MRIVLGFLGMVILFLGMVNHAQADAARVDAERQRTEVILETGEIDSRTVDVGALAVVVYGQGERHPTLGEWTKLDTARGYIKAVDQRRLIVGLEPDGWSKWIALERIQTLILVGETAAGRTDNGKVIDNSRKGHIRDQADSGHAAGGFQATPYKTEDRGGGVKRISGKLLRGVVGGYAFLWVGTLIGSGIDDYRDTCRGWFPSNDQYASEDGELCIDVAALMGAGTGWALGIPLGVSMLEPNDRFIHTLGGSLGGFVTCGLFTMVSGGALWPSMIVAPVVFATIASEWSRHAELSRKPLEARDKGRRFSIGLVPDSGGSSAAVVTLRF